MNKTKIPNRKGRTPPRGLNVRGLPRHVLAYLANTAKARGLNTEAYVRSEIIRHVDKKINPPAPAQTPPPYVIPTWPSGGTVSNHDSSIRTS